ncbi:MAG: hypothetical protein PF436_11900 [Prolixibacteraceae bacterium]|nr:hypothetical protein [Prolixibacteraceae bacterium]
MVIILSIILGIFVIAAVAFLVIVNRKKAKNDKTEGEPETVAAPPLDCCGAHEVCEYDEIKMDESRIEYYDDEELDQFKHIASNDFDDLQIDQFREVLYTLKTDEIRYWLLSIERRKINLPSILQDEARMLMAEG